MRVSERERESVASTPLDVLLMLNASLVLGTLLTLMSLSQESHSHFVDLCVWAGLFKQNRLTDNILMYNIYSYGLQ